MSDFVSVLQFTWVPFVGALVFCLTAAPLGAMLSLRDEILLGLALPPVGAAAIVFAVMAGVDPESSFPLYAAAVVAILAASLVLPGRGSQRFSPRGRAIWLVGVFCASEAAALLMGAASPRVEAHVHDMLRGEVLVMDRIELYGFVVLTLVALGIAFRLRGWLYSLALDQESLIIRHDRQGRRAVMAFRVAGALIIAAGVIWVGPLLTLGLLAIPTLIWERSARSLGGLVSGVTVIAVVGTAGGFTASIVADMPPVAMVIAALFVAGALSRVRVGSIRGTG